MPEVPLLISSAKFAVNITLDMLIISRFHLGTHTPTVNMQAAIQLCCNMTSALLGLVFFIVAAVWQQVGHGGIPARPSLEALKILARPGFLFFLESAIRNGIHLWLVRGIVSMGSNYASAWGVFNTIRWGLVMVPVQALETTSSTFIGHAWANFRARDGDYSRTPSATKQDAFRIAWPAFKSAIIVVAIEVPLLIFMWFWGVESFALYLSGSEVVAQMTAQMWSTIDWCYIMYALYYQLATIPLATRPNWYLYQSMCASILYALPWAFVREVADLNVGDAWVHHSLVLGGSLIVRLIIILLFDCLWFFRLVMGKMRLEHLVAVV